VSSREGARRYTAPHTWRSCVARIPRCVAAAASAAVVARGRATLHGAVYAAILCCEGSSLCSGGRLGRRRRARRATLHGARRGGAVHVTIVRREVERFDCRVLFIAAMHGLALVADDHIFHDAPDHVVEHRDPDERPVRPRHERGAEDDERDAGGAVEVALRVKFFVTARRASLDERIGRRRNDARWSAAEFTRMRRLSRLASEATLTLRTEEVNAGRYLARSM